MSTSTQEFRPDILIIGGGPTGCSAAIAAHNLGARVALVTKPSKRDWRPPELIPVAASAVLSSHGVNSDALLAKHRRIPRMRVYWGAASARERVTDFDQLHGRVLLDRESFDNDLLNIVKDTSADVIQGSPQSIERTENRWCIRITSGRYIFPERLLIATGRAGLAGDRNRLVCADRMLAVSFRLNSAIGPVSQRTENATGEFWIISRPTGWWYGVAGGASLSFAVHVTDPDLLPTGWQKQPKALFDSMPPELSDRTHFASAQIRCRAHSATMSGRAVVAGEGWAFAGDARLTVDPLSGGGVTRALEDGASTATWLLSDPDQIERRRFRCSHAAEYNDLLAIRRRIYSDEMRYHTSFWQRRQS